MWKPRTYCRGHCSLLKGKGVKGLAGPRPHSEFGAELEQGTGPCFLLLMALHILLGPGWNAAFPDPRLWYEFREVRVRASELAEYTREGPTFKLDSCCFSPVALGR